MILGLDISTSCTGITILDYAGNVILNTCWTFRQDDSFDKLTAAKKYITEIKNKYSITHIFIEESLQAFRPGFSSAKTILSLAKFNGILSWMLWEEIGIKPQYIGSGTARKTCGIKITKGKPAKEQVMEWMLENQKWFVVENKKNSEKIKDHYYDMSDSYVIARAGFLQITK
jgi:hypothetical protein